MLGTKLPDNRWQTLSHRLKTQRCPACKADLDRDTVYLQPNGNRLFVMCMECRYAFFNDDPDAPFILNGKD